MKLQDTPRLLLRTMLHSWEKERLLRALRRTKVTGAPTSPVSNTEVGLLAHRPAPQLFIPLRTSWPASVTPTMWVPFSSSMDTTTA